MAHPVEEYICCKLTLSDAADDLGIPCGYQVAPCASPTERQHVSHSVDTMITHKITERKLTSSRNMWNIDSMSSKCTA